jgi:hypothetical protein
MIRCLTSIDYSAVQQTCPQGGSPRPKPAACSILPALCTVSLVRHIASRGLIRRKTSKQRDGLKRDRRATADSSNSTNYDTSSPASSFCLKKLRRCSDSALATSSNSFTPSARNRAITFFKLRRYSSRTGFFMSFAVDSDTRIRSSAYGQLSCPGHVHA